MSIFRCENCQHQKDSDFVMSEIFNGEEVCEDCYIELQGDQEPDYESENYFEKKAREHENFKR